MNGQNEDGSRRDFLKLAAGAAALTSTLARPRHARAEEAVGCGDAGSPAHPRVGLATIGVGGQGTRDTKGALEVDGVHLVGVADVYQGRLDRAREVFCPDLVVTRDYKEILARKDVDAVIIGTPDHWHAPIAVEAMEAGKDVYVEKPMVHAVEEGARIVEAQKRTGRICQVGSQRVSSVVYHKAKELLAAGAIGELNLVEAWWNRNSAIGAWQYTIPTDASPQTVDWDRFVGPAPKRPFDATRAFRWRNYDDYGTGVAGDLFVHLFSGLHVITGALGPTRVMATGGLRRWKDGRDAPDVVLGLFEYPKTATHPEFTLSLKVNFADGAGEDSGFRFVGPEGVMTVGGDTVRVTRRAPSPLPGYTIDTFAKPIRDAFKKGYDQQYADAKRQLRTGAEELYRAPEGYSDQDHHLANFIEAVRTRKPVVEDPSFGLRAAGPALLANRSLREKKAFGWDPAGMRVV